MSQTPDVLLQGGSSCELCAQECHGNSYVLQHCSTAAAINASSCCLTPPMPQAPSEGVIKARVLQYTLSHAQSRSRASADSGMCSVPPQIRGWPSYFHHLQTCLRHCLCAVPAGDDVDKKKPDPKIYNVAAQKLGLNPADCLVVEDSTIGLQAALGAGMRCIITYTPSTKQQVRGRGWWWCHQDGGGTWLFA